MSYWEKIEHHIGGEQEAAFWMAHPPIRAYVNRAISGSASIWPVEWFCQRFSDRLPWDSAVVVGCGTGGLERDLLGKGAARKIIGVDMVSAPLEYANQAAKEAGLGASLDYVHSDGREFLRNHPRRFDAVIFHASLHHFDRMAEITELAKVSLKTGGCLYLDEYVGPSMSEWNILRLLLPNLAYYALPSRVRRPGLVRTPINPDDPTEAICSSDILPEVNSRFRTLVKRDYGGNLLSLIFPNLRRPGSGEGAPSDAVFACAVSRLIRFEKILLRTVASHHTLLIASPRK